MKALVIVESPAKVKTIHKILGDQYKVVSSMGHLIDLPKSSLGVDLEHDFHPRWVVVREKKKVLFELKKEAANKKEIYVATDPDREGEAIGWNIAHQIGDEKKFYRVTFHEITKEAVLKAFQTTQRFDEKKVNAQVARRILDRIVGYQISPLLWKKVGSRLSAGRVQSVALRLVVERERAIQGFTPQEYWMIEVDLHKAGISGFLRARLEKIDGKDPGLPTQAVTQNIIEEIQKQKFAVSAVIEKEVKRNPFPPFITSTLQQEAFHKLGFNAARTMMVAQELYEGLEIGKGEAVGLITYMRTDSVNVAGEAINRVRNLIKKDYGNSYLPEKPNFYKSRKSAQEAHEAIRPTDVLRRPEDLKAFLEGDQYKLYDLIWRRFVSSQMTPAVYQQKRVEIKAGRFEFSSSVSTLVFDGYLKVEKEIPPEEKAVDLSHYFTGDALELVEAHPSQHFTKPPPRYSEASLVKTLEEGGIGRPSTYASIIQTLVARNYVIRERGYFTATELGMKICDLLVEYFPKVMDIGFTALMEENLDLVEEGKLEYTKLLKGFYQPFKEELDFAMKHITKTQTLIDKRCPQCGKPLTIKWGRKGKFLSCSGFPGCKYAEAFSTGIKCPEEGCGGELVERRSKRGGIFWGCSHFPKCRHISRKLPQTV